MPIDGWLAGIVVVGPAGAEIEGIVVPVDVAPVGVVLDWVVVEDERAPPRPGDLMATVRCSKSLEANRPISAGSGSGETVPVARWLVGVVEKVAGDRLQGAVDAQTAPGAPVAASPWWLRTVVVCPWCVAAWVPAAVSPCWPAAPAVCRWCTTAGWTAWGT